jgi:hypothetical protein
MTAHHFFWCVKGIKEEKECKIKQGGGGGVTWVGWFPSASYMTSITTWAERGLHNTACHNWSYAVFNRCWCSLNINAHRNDHKKLWILWKYSSNQWQTGGRLTPRASKGSNLAAALEPSVLQKLQYEKNWLTPRARALVALGFCPPLLPMTIFGWMQVLNYLGNIHARDIITYYGFTTQRESKIATQCSNFNYSIIAW